MTNHPRPFRFITGELPRSGWQGAWRPDPESVSHLARLSTGTPLTVVKRAPDESEAARYAAHVVPTYAPPPWVEVEAVWTHRTVDVAGLIFEPGDMLREFFSPVHPFNAFALRSATGMFKGWYGNVTFPAFLIGDGSPPDCTLVWHDLYLDVVILADGTVSLLDDDELAASGIPASHPDLARAIEAARDELITSIPTFSITVS